jgi:Tfp pilus assembly protein PilO
VKISKRETLLGLIALTAILFGLTYWLAGSHIEEQREIQKNKARLLHQIEMHKRILAEKEAWYGRLEELQAQLPVYDENISITAELLKFIKRTADAHGLDLVRTQPTSEKQTGSLYELGVSCSWEGTLDSLVKFLYDIQSQGIRFDVLQLTAQPDAQRDRILKGSMTIDCAYRKGKPEIQNPESKTN